MKDILKEFMKMYNDDSYAIYSNTKTTNKKLEKLGLGLTSFIKNIANEKSEFHTGNPTSFKNEIIGNTIRKIIEDSLKSQKQEILEIYKATIQQALETQKQEIIKEAENLQEQLQGGGNGKRIFTQFIDKIKNI